MFYRVAIQRDDILYPLFTSDISLTNNNTKTIMIRRRILDYFDDHLIATHQYGVHWYTEKGWKKFKTRSINLALLFGTPVIFTEENLPFLKYEDDYQVVVRMKEMHAFRQEVIPTFVLNDYLSKIKDHINVELHYGCLTD